MDFDPSAFLSMDMTEDQTVYTAPDVPQGFSPVKVPCGNIVVEGGLQMEQGVQIPVPMFGLLQDQHMEEEEFAGETNQNDSDRLGAPIHIDVGDTDNNTTPQGSPGEKALSPCNKKVIQTTFEETRFRKDLFCGHYERVKMFRLHCTICAKHLGCAPWFTERQMRMHKLFSVMVCRKCFEFYGDVNFPLEDGSELYCSWCGEGGECFCCSTCPKIVCKRCIKRNFGADKIKEIDKNDDWSCFVCKPEDIWPHRAVMWGLQRWSKGMRQLVAMLSKEEKQARLSMDTSHCCKGNEQVTCVGIPGKIVLTKVPLSMIAVPYLPGVKKMLERQETHSGSNNSSYFPTNSYISRPELLPSLLTQRVAEVTRIPGNLSQQNPVTPVGFVRQVQKVVCRTPKMIRPGPYPKNRNVSPMPRPSPPLLLTQQTVARPIQVAHYRPVPPLSLIQPPSHQPDVIDLEKESILQPIDISPIENSVKDVKDVLRPMVLMLDQFDHIKNDLANDFSKLTSFSERLSYNIKIAICNLAKANTDLIESQKKLIDNRVSNVVNSMQLSANKNVHLSVVNDIKPPVVNGTVNRVNQNGTEPPSKGSSPPITAQSSPGIEVNQSPKTPSVEQETSATPSSSMGEEMEELPIALLCETVLEVEENKENKDDANKDQTAPGKEPEQGTDKAVKGKPQPQKNIRKRPLEKTAPLEIINLVDDEDDHKGQFDESQWCKKFNIAPCKVLLKKLGRHGV